MAEGEASRGLDSSGGGVAEKKAEKIVAEKQWRRWRQRGRERAMRVLTGSSNCQNQVFLSALQP